jgi:uncharacterized protein (TIGR00369 family)
MDDADDGQVPAGFEQLPVGLGFSDVLQPLYRRLADGQVSFGLRVGEQHCNAIGICHGGVIMTLADLAAANGANQAGGRIAGSPTINLSIDFISACKRGEWLQADIAQATARKRFGFASGMIHGPRGPVARFSGTFYFPDHEGLLQEGNKLARLQAMNAAALDRGSGEG